MNSNLKIRPALYLSFLLLTAPLLTNAQDEIAQFLQAKKEDASNLVQAYMSPVVKGIAYGMTQGWYHTAKAHKTLGFDVGVSFNVVNIPSFENYFDPRKFLSTSTTFNSTASNGLAPTVVGPKVSTTYTSTYDPDGSGSIPSQTVTIDGPDGLDLKKEVGVSAVPVPMVQVGVGIIKNTDLKIRFIPKQEVGASDVSMLGFGVLHDVKQHIPGIRLLPFDLAALVGYNVVKGSTSLEGELPKPSGYTGPQAMEYKFSSLVVQALVSKKFSVVTVYGGVGYSTVKTNLDVVGEYQVNASPATFTIKNPISMKFNEGKTARLTAGARLKFGPIYLNGEYTLQKFSAYTVGLGVAVR